MANTPIYSLGLWAGPQATPWVQHDAALRLIEALIRASVADRDLTAPPGSCADGTGYLVKATATGAWAGHAGQLAVAVGANAANGWMFAAIAKEGAILWVEDEDVRLEYNGSTWVTFASGGGSAGVPKVRAATTANGTLASAFENGDAIDGVTLATGDRILLKNQSAAAENGVYTVNASGAPTRATDADSSAELVNYACLVAEGTANADKFFQCTTNAPITVGTTGLTWVEFSGGGGGGTAAWQLQWGPVQNEPPATNFATLDTRNNHSVLDFDTTTQETAIFSGILPASYGGGGVTVSLWCALTSATTGTVGWDVAIERIDASSLDIDSDSFATAATVTAVTVPGTSGQVLKMSVNIANGSDMDSLAAGELFRLRVRRDVANDTATGDAELLRVGIKEQ